MPRPLSYDANAVVNAAMQAFWGGGVSGTSVDDLLRATGLSRSSLYNSFGSREGLMQAATERYAQWQSAAIRKLFSRRSLEEAMMAMLMEAATSNYDGRGCLLVNAVGELHECPGAGLEAVQAALAEVAATLESAIRGAAPERDDVPQLCVAVMAAIAGLRTMQRAALPLPLRREAAQRLAKGLVGS